MECRRTFSTQSFESTYWLGRPEILAAIADLAVSCVSLRQIARLVGTTHTTVARHIARLGRHCLLFHCQRIAHLSVKEPLVIDGFETFEYSQYFPFHFNLAVGKVSWFLYHFTDAPLRRKGTMTPFQKARRAELEARLGRPERGVQGRSIRELLEPLYARTPVGKVFEVHSDDHPIYPAAIQSVQKEGGPPIVHLRTSGRERRTARNPLFPVNLADLLIRHTSANHKRETIAFSRRRQAAAERLAIHLVWRNYVKPRREKSPGETAAMVLGVVSSTLSFREVLRHRLFPSVLPAPWEAYYWGQVRTAVFPRQRAHTLAYAW